SLSGIPYTASYVATNAQIAPSLGRNVSACTTQVVCNATAIVDLIEPYTQFESRINQLDLRLTRILTLKKGRVAGNVDIYNVFNVSPIGSETVRYGPAWRAPSTILGGRLFKFGAQYEF